MADVAGPENPGRDAGFAGDVRGEVVAAPPANGAGEKRKKKYRVLSSEYRAEESGAAFGRLDLADVAQLVEHSLGKGEVISSILIIGSRVWFC